MTVSRGRAGQQGRARLGIGATVATVVLLGAMAMPQGAQAQDPIELVSNTDRPRSRATTNLRAQRFTTGNHAAGYEIREVTLWLGNNASDAQINVSIRRGSATAPEPGESGIVVRLERSDPIRRHVRNTFYVPENHPEHHLDPDTQYWLTVHDGIPLGIETARLWGTDMRGQTGVGTWTIADQGLQRTSEASPWREARTLMMAITGIRKQEPAPVPGGLVVSERGRVLDGSRCTYVYPAGPGCESETAPRPIGDPIQVTTSDGTDVTGQATLTVQNAGQRIVSDEQGNVHEVRYRFAADSTGRLTTIAGETYPFLESPSCERASYRDACAPGSINGWTIDAMWLRGTCQRH